MVMISLIMYMCGIVSFSINRKHLLLMLLSLEFIMISLYFFIVIYLSSFNFEMYFCLIFLTMSVCEGVLGLAVLVSLIRFSGNDYFQSLSVLW
uniref:NADH-ubiquinone oxidoreductase chain 4L n=1 Tax=Staphylinidae sp. BMNH 1274674 TaxID=1796592 RepID=A0A126TG69_9COLE|nr:NADH dehydrogenase subunit 4L [Staphylinidae sp. BMNH 1274674]